MGDCADIFYDFIFGHTEAGIGNGDFFSFFIELDIDFQIQFFIYDLFSPQLHQLYFIQPKQLEEPHWHLKG